MNSVIDIIMFLLIAYTIAIIAALGILYAAERERFNPKVFVIATVATIPLSVIVALIMYWS